MYLKLEEKILATCQRFPNKISLQLYINDHWQRLTYAELREQAGEGAKTLKEIGIKKGDRVVLMTHNCPDAMVAYLSVLMADATVVFMDPALSHDELNKLFECIDARALLIAEKYVDHFPLSLAGTLAVRKIKKGLPAFEGDFYTEVNPTLPQSLHTDTDVATILFTSGTTGHAKAAMITHQNMLTAIKLGIDAIQAVAEDSVLSVLPIHHISPLVHNILSLSAGSTITCIDKLDSASIQAALRASKPTIAGFVPLILEMFLNQIELKISQSNEFRQFVSRLLLTYLRSVRSFTSLNLGLHFLKAVHVAFGGNLSRIICGGATLKPSVKAKYEAMGFSMIEAYGLTETTGPICSNRLETLSTDDVGTPFPDHEFKIETSSDAKEGEVCIRGPLIMKGYFNDPKGTEEVLKNGWFYTGDIGFINHKGHLKITGRKKEIIVLSSGKKAVPAHIEDHYHGIPGVAELSVFGAKIHSSDEMICAAIVIENQQKIEAQIEAEIIKRASTLPAYLKIQSIYFVQDIPKTTTLKVKRIFLKKQVEEGKLLPFYAEHEETNIHHSIDTHEIEQWMKHAIATKQNIAVDAIDRNKSFHYYGLNSLMAVQLCEELSQWLSQPIHPSLIWEYPTIAKLAAHLSKNEKPTLPNETYVSSPASHEPIAIISTACKLPGGIKTPEAFWDALLKGHNLIKEMPKERSSTTMHEAIRSGGFIDHIDLFDASFFEISPLEANDMDPQHRLLLEASWEALERGNIIPASLEGSKTGVYIGICTNDYGLLQAENNLDAITPYFGLGNSLSAAAGRIAYFLGLQGICKAIDTACSSSLTALHDACQDLRNGLSDTAIVGGVNAILSPLASMSFHKARMLASDGRCKVFDEKADGYIRSEGCGVVILKRLSDAERDGNPILATILGSAMNQDGHSNGITAPNGEAQAKLYRQALQKTQLEAHHIDYIETHGTGTPLGDPIEVRSITQVYSDRSAETPLYLGAVKSHVGHLEAAAGITGLIKTILVLQHKKIPAQINFNRLNPLIDLTQKNIKIPTDLIDLSHVKEPLIAAVNAFGFTGTNVHIILKEAPSSTVITTTAKPYYLVALSAKTETALKNKLFDLKTYLENNTQNNLAEISAILNARRQHFEKRCAFVVTSSEQLLEELQKAYQDFNAIRHCNLSCTLQSEIKTLSKEEVKKLDALSPVTYQSILLNLANNYIEGYTIDWDILNEEPSHKKAILPSYPFERQSYWFKKKAKNDAHPLLGTLKVRTANQMIFETIMHATSPDFMQDHKIYDIPIAPFALYLSVALELITFKSLNNPCIDNFKIFEPLMFTDHSPCIVQTKLSEEHGSLSFEILSQACDDPNAAWKLHAKGIIKEDSISEHPIDSLETIKARCNKKYSADELYRDAHNLGMSYAHQFQKIEKIDVGQNEALGYFMDHDSSPHYVLHPGLIDCCLQTLFGLQSKNLHALHIPVSLQQFKYDSHLGKICFVYVNSDHTSNTAHFYFLNATGLVIGKIIGLTVKKVTKEILLKQKVPDYFYETILQPQALSSLDKSLSRCLVISHTITSQQSIEDLFGKESVLIDHHHAEDQYNKSWDNIIYYPALKINPASLTTDALRIKQQEIIFPFLKFLKAQVKNTHTTLWLVIDNMPWSATLEGIFKTFLIEYPTIIGRIIELDHTDHALKIIANEIKNTEGESYVAYRHSIRHVQRLKTFESHKQVLSYPESSYFHLTIPKRGFIQNLQLQTIEPHATLAPHQVAIKIKAAGVNFRDVLNTLGLYPGDPGPLGGDCAGIVTAVGDGVKTIKPGDAVLGFALSGAFANYAISEENLVVTKPDHFTFPEAATLPTAFLTAHFAFHHLAQVKKGDKVLIHAATGGVGIAAIQIALDLGAIVYATAGNTTKRDYLKSLGVHHIYDSRSHIFSEAILSDTDGHGVDVVLNSLSGEGFIEKTVKACGANARFLEIGKRDIWTTDKMAATRNDIQYHIIALDELIVHQPAFIKSMFKELMPLMQKNNLQPLPVTLFSLEQTPLAFQLMQKAQHIGKIVVTIQPPVNKMQPESCYLITGGLGALGLQLVTWLSDHGAKNIMLLSRRSPSQQDQQHIAQLEKDHGLSIQTLACDVANLDALKKLFEAFGTTLPPLKGIIHAAGVLQDKLFLEQEWNDFDHVFMSKVYGAWNLHQMTKNLDLDFFILFSSIASVLGSPGQTNYSAANAFLDKLASYRQTLGLPALSINWGPWSHIGMAAHLENLMMQRGITSLSPSDALKLFSTAIKQTTSQLVIISATWEKIKNSSTFLTSILKDMKTGVTKTEKSAPALLLSKVKTASAKERLDLLHISLNQCISDITGIASEKLNATTDFDALGMDSLMILQLHSFIEDSLGKNILGNISEISQFNTIDKLAHLIESKLSMSTETPVVTAPTNDTTHKNKFNQPIKLNHHLSVDDLFEIETYIKNLIHPQTKTRLSKQIFRTILWSLCKFYFKVSIKGLENLPTDRSFIICPNHTSYLDSVALGLASRKFKRKFIGLLAEDYFSKKLFPLIDLAVDVVPFDRQKNEYALAKNLKYIELCKQANTVLLLFPEGTRSQDGSIQKFKTGAAWLSEQTGLDIVPAYIEGGFDLLPRGRLFPKPGKLTITFGHPLSIHTHEESGNMLYQHFTQRLLDAIVALRT